MTIGDNNPVFSGHQISEAVFSNYLILGEVAKYCAFEDLKSLRRLTTTCYAASLKTWRAKSTVCIGPFRGMGGICVKEFMGRYKNSEELGDGIFSSFQNFRIQFCSLPTDDLTENELLSRAEYAFWIKCGGNIKNLDLNHCKFHQRSLMNLICNFVPNLETLKISIVLKAYQGDCLLEDDKLRVNENLRSVCVSGHLPFPNWRFLKYFPNLKEITLGRNADKNLIQDLYDLQRQSQGQHYNLKCLDLIHSTNQSLHGLADAHYPLEHLSLRLDRDLQEDTLRDILQSSAGTLQSLRVFRFPLQNYSPLNSTPFHSNFPSLKELHLWGNVVTSFNFLKWMPSLKKLVVDLGCYDRIFDIYDDHRVGRNQIMEPYSGDMVKNSNVLMETKNFEHLNLEEFQADCEFSLESLKLLGKWIPNLKIFGSILNDQALRVVCSQWKALVDLKLEFGSNVSDQGITGVTLESVVGKEKRQPNLTDLNELRRFELRCYCESSSISDVSVSLAFLDMAQLECLKICVSPQMTEVAEAMLRESIQNTQITRNYGIGHSKLPLNCCHRASIYCSKFSL